MRLEEINEALKTLNIPVAYRSFKEKPDSIPFCVYYIDSENIRGSDFENLILERDVTIELYTENKDTDIEIMIENLFHNYEINKDEYYIDDEKLLMNVFKFTLINKL